MSTVVDNRVVEMQFDNKHFEANVQTSLSTLDKLKQSLNLTGATKGFENVTAAANKVNMSGLTGAVETVRLKFSALEVMAVTALSNITNSAVNAGKRIVSALTIEPVKTGFNEYELKMGSIQTIMAGTGASLEAVNGYLNELNEYSDKTIYSFADMTNNIGKFTNAGVKLDDAVLAMKGIANAAALSGATANQASHAMYNFSQALSKGYVQLIDWKSIELAQMATVEFKTQLLESAEAAGTLTKTADGMYQTLDGNLVSATHNFNDSLKDQWLTTDVLIGTLRDYSDETTEIGAKATEAATKVRTFSKLFDTLKEAAQSGWAQTWETIVGDFNEATDLFTKINDVVGGWIGKTADLRNNYLSEALDSNWERLAKKVQAAGVPIEEFQNALIETGKAHGVVTDEMIEKEGGFVKSLEKNWATSSIVIETLKKFTGQGKEAAESVGSMTDKLEAYRKVVSEVWGGKWGNGAERIKKLTEAGYDYATVQKLVNKNLNGNAITSEHLADVVDKLSDSELKNIGYTDDEIKKLRELAEQAEKTGTPLNELISDLSKPSGREILFQSFAKILQEISKVLDVIKDTWEKVFGEYFADKNLLKDIIEAFGEFTENIEITDEALDNIAKTIEGFFRAIEIAAVFSGGVFGIIRKIVRVLMNVFQLDFLGLTARLGELITKFRDWLFINNDLTQSLIDIGNKIADFITKFVDKVKELFAAFMQMPIIQEKLNDIKTGLGNLFSGIKNFLTGVLDSIDNFIDKIKEMDSLSLENIFNAFKGFGKNLIDNIFSFEFSFENIKNALQKFRDKLSEGFGKIFDKFDWVKDKLCVFWDFLKDKIPAIIGLLSGALLIRALTKFAKAMELLAQPLQTVKKLNGVLDALEQGLKNGFESKADRFKKIADGVMRLAIAIGILVAAVWILSEIPKEDLWRGVGALAVLIVALTALAGVVALMGKFNLGVEKGATSILALGGALLLVAIALKKMDELNPDKLAANVTALGIMLVALGVVAAFLATYAPNLSKGCIGLVAMAIALKIMVGALADLDEIEFKNLEQSIWLLVGIVGALGAMAIFCKGTSFGSMAGLLTLVIALKMMVGVLEDIAEVDFNKLKDSIGSFIIIFGSIALLMVASKFAGNNALKAGFGILAITAALILMTVAIKLLANITESDLDKAANAITKLLLVFALIIASSALAGKNAVKAGVMLMAMAGAMLIMTLVIAILKNMDPDGLDQAMGIIETLGIIFGALIAVTKLAGDKVVGKLITIAAVIVALSVVVMLLTSIATSNPAGLKAATDSLVTIMGALAVLIGMTKLLNTVNWWQSLILITAMGLVIAGLGLVLNELVSSCSDADSALKIAVALSVLIVALSGACALLGIAGAVWTAALAGIGVLMVLIGAMTLLVGILYQFADDIDFAKVDKAIKFLEKIGEALGGFFGGIVGGFLGGVNAGIASTLPEIGKNLADFGASVSSVSSDAVDGAKNIADILWTLGKANFIDSFSWGNNDADKYTEQLVPFAKAVASFASQCAYIPAGAVEKAKPAFDAVLDILTSLPNDGGVAGFFAGNNDPERYTEQLVPFAKAVASFAGQCAYIPVGAIEKAKPSIDAMISILDSLPNDGGVWGFLAGNNDPERYTEQLVPFAKAVASFANQCAYIPVGAIEKAKPAIDAVVDILNTLPNDGGVWGFLAGNNDPEVYTTQLVPFGKAVKNFSYAVDGTNPESVENAKPAIKSMIDVLNMLPKEGGLLRGLVGLFAGEQDAESFGSKLSALGSGVKNYVSAFSGIELGSLENAKPAVQSMIDVLGIIPKDGGLFEGIGSLFVGENGVDLFISNLKALATGTKTFASAFLGTNIEGIGNAKPAVQAMIDTLRIIPKEGGLLDGLFGLFSGEDGTSSFLSKITSLASATKQFASAFSGTNVESINLAKPAVQAMIDILNMLSSTDVLTTFSEGSSIGSLGSQMITLGTSIRNFSYSVTGLDFVGVSTAIGVIRQLITVLASIATGEFFGVEEFVKAVNDLGNVSIDAFVDAFSESSEKIEGVGKDMVKNFIKGLKEQSDAEDGGVVSACESIAKAGISGIESQISGFYDAGKNVAKGFANGISAGTFMAAARAKAMAEAALAAARRVLLVRSPSKAFYKIGAFGGQGFINAFADYTSKSYEAGAQIAKSSIKGLSNSIGRIKDVIDSDIDAQPTIRPVLDLSDVSSGASAINGMLNMNPSIGVLSNVRSINSMMNESQNGVNDDVISAIKDLGKKINAKSGDTYQINGITYDDGSNISDAIQTLIRAAKVERRI